MIHDLTGVGRSLGIPAIPEAPWGSHFCQFFRTRQDLVDILVPYFREGLANNEFCVWVTSDPLQTTAALEAMHTAVPGFDDALVKGQIEFLRHESTYAAGGAVEPGQLVAAWVEKLAAARANGYEGMRATGYVPWLDKTGWRDFTDYEAALDAAIDGRRIIAMCGYSLDTCTASELVDVLENHRVAVVRRDDEWSLIEPTERVPDTPARQRARLAREINDTIVQGLVATELSYDLGEGSHARDLLRATSRQAREWVGQLLEDQLPLGVARREEAPSTPSEG